MNQQLKLLILPLIKDDKLRNKIKSKKSLNQIEKFLLLDLIGFNEKLRENVLIEEYYQELGNELSLKESA